MIYRHITRLKLGAAVYFGLDPTYCLKEAMNTLLEEEYGYLKRQQLSIADKFQIQQDRLVCLEVGIDLIHGPTSLFSFGNYQDGQKGTKSWPLFDHHGTMTSATTPVQPFLPNGRDEITSAVLSSEQWDEYTERLTSDYLQSYYGIDALTINEDTENQFEIAIFEPDCIVSIQPWNG